MLELVQGIVLILLTQKDHAVLVPWAQCHEAVPGSKEAAKELYLQK